MNDGCLVVFLLICVASFTVSALYTLMGGWGIFGLIFITVIYLLLKTAFGDA